MSRVAKNPIVLPKNVEVSVSGSTVTVKGSKGVLVHKLNPQVSITHTDNVLKLAAKANTKFARAMAGTTRALLHNMVAGVSTGYEKKLSIIGVGYRAAVQNRKLNLTLGFSHPVDFDIPEGITIETPSQTEIIVRGIDKHMVGQVAANIRAYRSPEPYKGKGVRYVDERIIRKEAKKA